MSRRRRWVKHVVLVLVVLGICIGGGLALLVTGSRPLTGEESIAPGITTVVSRGFIAAYIVEYDEGVVLVDATLDPEAADILAGLDNLGHSREDVRAILLTHGHGDHIAGVRAFPEARVFAMAEDADLVAGKRVAGNLPGRFRDPEPTGIDVDDVLADRDVVQLGDLRVEVYAIPGHTRGSAAYLLRRVLFLGDAAAAAADGSLTSAPPVFSWDRELARQSLHRLAESVRPRADEIDAMAFGHQGPLPGIDALLEWHAGRN